MGPIAWEFEHDWHDEVGLSLHNAQGLSKDNLNGEGLELSTGVLMHGLPLWLQFPHSLDVVVGFPPGFRCKCVRKIR